MKVPQAPVIVVLALAVSAGCLALAARVDGGEAHSSAATGAPERPTPRG